MLSSPAAAQQLLIRPLALMSLLAAIGLNVAVLTMCNFLELQQDPVLLRPDGGDANVDVERDGSSYSTTTTSQHDSSSFHFGLFSYATSSLLNGQCVGYGSNNNELSRSSVVQNDETSAAITTARIGSILALTFGTTIFVLLLLSSSRTSCCRTDSSSDDDDSSKNSNNNSNIVPQYIVNILFVLVQIFASLTWFVYHSNLCITFGCSWGKGATVQLISQVRSSAREERRVVLRSAAAHKFASFLCVSGPSFSMSINFAAGRWSHARTLLYLFWHRFYMFYVTTLAADHVPCGRYSVSVCRVDKEGWTGTWRRIQQRWRIWRLINHCA